MPSGTYRDHSLALIERQSVVGSHLTFIRLVKLTYLISPASSLLSVSLPYGYGQYLCNGLAGDCGSREAMTVGEHGLLKTRR